MRWGEVRWGLNKENGTGPPGQAKSCSNILIIVVLWRGLDRDENEINEVT